MRLGAAARRRLGSERGLTLVEVMVAAMVLVLGAIAIFRIVDAATRTSYRAEQSQVVSNLLQRELERVKAREPSQVAVSDPAACSDLPAELEERWTAEAFDDRPWVTAGADVAEPLAPCEPVAIAEDGGADSSDVSVIVYRMITWFDPDNQACLPPDLAENAADACGMRRITIGAKPVESGPGGERAYKEIQSDIVDIRLE